MIDELSQVDLAFCVDLTNSMTPFIQAAQQHVAGILDGLRAVARADLRVALVGYRDHDGDAAVTEVHPFTDDVRATRDALYALRVGSPPGNTDAAEAVVAGLVACVRELEWRPQSYRALVLVGDGGTGNPTRCPRSAPCARRRCPARVTRLPSTLAVRHAPLLSWGVDLRATFGR